MTYDMKKNEKKVKKGVDFSGDCDILISVMGNMTFDDLSCEEVFELNAMCDEWQRDAIEAQELEREADEARWNALGVDVK